MSSYSAESPLPPQDYDSGRHESIKLEKNSKGVNVSLRTVKADRETDAAWLERTLNLYRDILTQVR